MTRSKPMRDATIEFTALGRVLGGLRGLIFRLVVSSFPYIPDSSMCAYEFQHCFDTINNKKVFNCNKYLMDLTIKYMHCVAGDRYSDKIQRVSKEYLFDLDLEVMDELKAKKVGPLISRAFKTRATKLVDGKKVGRYIAVDKRIDTYGTKGLAWIIQKGRYSYIIETVEGAYAVSKRRDLSQDRIFLNDFNRDLRQIFRKETSKMGLTATLALEATDSQKEDGDFAIATTALGHILDHDGNKVKVQYSPGGLLYVPVSGQGKGDNDNVSSKG